MIVAPYCMSMADQAPKDSGAKGENAMFTNRLRFVLILSAIFVSVPWIANASTAALTFTGVNGMNDGHFYFDPYLGRINNGPVIDIWCVDYAHDAWPGQSWTVNVTSTMGAGGSFGNTYLGNKNDYLAILWLINQYQSLPNSTSTPTLAQLKYQYAIWSFSGWSTTDGTLMAQVEGVKGNALSAVAQGYDPSGWVILTDINDTQQEFIADPVPEPSLMLLILVGLSAVCVYCYRAECSLGSDGPGEVVLIRSDEPHGGPENRACVRF